MAFCYSATVRVNNNMSNNNDNCNSNSDNQILAVIIVIIIIILIVIMLHIMSLRRHNHTHEMITKTLLPFHHIYTSLLRRFVSVQEGRRESLCGSLTTVPCFPKRGRHDLKVHQRRDCLFGKTSTPKESKWASMTPLKIPMTSAEAV